MLVVGEQERDDTTEVVGLSDAATDSAGMRRQLNSSER